ncbi:SprT-like family-domain-containing protein [Lobosporangium transversale]|uniref:Protein with SprT-like domain at the N terminus n=1 Tax=Lobosporangium transversale TaxID=64571 RepID=A0A1Y2H1R4_9FUNG|nr:SprT-like family-domain-containing protein [Lobosporangium transversale]ORZ28500.1 SprT-like family-domain-containing protein [Lobosporangium transversale]|eukprot:XP_021886185.1 SprT-like family-domain-containing protein [Lobosporangium transversale]
MVQSDEELARLLQEQEYGAVGSSSLLKKGDIDSPFIIPEDDDYDNGVTPPDLDTEAPFKDLHGLFLAFNDQYFESKLSACEVRWSPRMTRCAGLCYYQSKAQYCSIRLSEPLLKFRPESDYIDTLLHEMIHAYLFVTKAIQDHDGHGADFQYHMNRINKAAGTSITIYHTFHDEVRHYQTHIWKCNGPCQHRPPYYGIVKRSMNRPPQPADRWFAEHQMTCGGTYTKISEPESMKKKKPSSKSQKNAKPDPESKGRTLIDDFFSPSKTASETNSSKSSSLSLTSLNNKDGSNKDNSILIHDADHIDNAKNFIPGSSELTDDVQQNDSSTTENIFGKDKEVGINPLSPREAAAAAALRRFERHLNQTSINMKSLSPLSSSSKRKTVAAADLNDKDALRSKRMKEEGIVYMKRNTTDSGQGKESVVLIKRSTSSSTRIEDPYEGSDTGVQRGALDNKEVRVNTGIKSSPSGPSSMKAEVVDALLVSCPICTQKVEEATINDHVDLCIWHASGAN